MLRFNIPLEVSFHISVQQTDQGLLVIQTFHHGRQSVHEGGAVSPECGRLGHFIQRLVPELVEQGLVVWVILEKSGNKDMAAC